LLSTLSAVWKYHWDWFDDNDSLLWECERNDDHGLKGTGLLSIVIIYNQRTL
jgi:hypothetical protein